MSSLKSSRLQKQNINVMYPEGLLSLDKNYLAVSIKLTAGIDKETGDLPII